ncbi:MAG: hypothetical protein GYA36_19645 [Veillonellaceae bacterium]|nr:hypothetical protein [Veillonellaceae bacterium]
MSEGELNRTELLQILRSRGISHPALTKTREQLVDIVRAAEEATGANDFVSRIDRYRLAIMTWAADRWSKIYNQVSCPLQDDGCGSCTDFRVVSCLIHNSHAFDVTKEVQMGTWGDAIKLIVQKKNTEAAALLGEAMAKPLAADKPTMSALAKIAKAAMDLKTNGKAESVTHYFDLKMKDCPPAVADFLKGKEPGQILADVVTLLGGGNGKAVSDPPPAASEGEPVREEEAYFPGVEVDNDEPLKPGQDAGKFVKGAEAKPTESEPQTAPQATEKPLERASAPLQVASSPTASVPKTPVSEVTEQARAEELAIADIARGLHLVSQGFETLAAGITLLFTEVPMKAPVAATPPQPARALDIPASPSTPKPSEGDIFFEDDEPVEID